MIGILIVSHDAFGDALIHSANHALGKCPPRLQSLGIAAHDDPEAVLPRAQELVRQLDAGDGVLVLTDMPGATPCNIATRLLAPGKVEGLSGASLPMLMRALTYRDEPLATVVQKAMSGGRDCMIHLAPQDSHAATRS